MRLNITVDIDGTDEQQFDMLELLEVNRDDHTLMRLWDDHTMQFVEAHIVSVTEVPERQVRGPAKQVP